MTLPVRRILVAPDSFKGSLTAAEAAAAMAEGIRRVDAGIEINMLPVSDGGEGLVAVLTPALGGKEVASVVQGPLPGQHVTARWGHVPGSATAIIEMAEAAGIGLVPAGQRDPRITTTFGVGQLIEAALDRNVRAIIVGIGGSATNDGGAGMASALGAEFLDESGELLPYGGAALARLARISTERLDMRLRSVQVTAACDVTNPLTGPEGASRVYAPQKGAGPEIVELLETALCRYAAVLRTGLGREVAALPGSGAAGGLGAGLLAFCDADLRSGIDIVMDATGFERALAEADLVLTGEGKIDAQTRAGKALSGILSRARQAGVPVAAVVGCFEGDRSGSLKNEGYIDAITLVDSSTNQQSAMARAGELLADRTAELLRRLTGSLP